MDGNKFLFDRIAEAVQATGQGDKYSRGMCNGMLFVKSLIDGKEPEYFREADGGKAQEEADEKKFLKSIANIRPTVDVERGKEGELGARIVELEELLRDRETALSMCRVESEKRLHEIMELRGKVAEYENAMLARRLESRF